METQTQEYVTAYIDVENTTEGAIYVSQETTRAIVADAWSGLENELLGANQAFADMDAEPHARILTILEAFRQGVRYADVIYYLTPIPDEEIEDA